MKRFKLAIILLLWTYPILGQWQSVGNVDGYSARDDNELIVRAGKSALQIIVLASDVIRVRLAQNGTFGPDMSWAVVKEDWPEVKTKITDSPRELRIATDELIVVMRKSPLRLTFLNALGDTINQDEPSKGMSWSGTEVRVWKNMPFDEYYYGFGEKAGRFGRKYTHMTMWNSDIPGYRPDTDPLYQTIPFFYGIKQGRAYGIFFDNSYWSSFDMGKESRDQYSFGAEDGELNYYFFYGPSPKKVLSRFTELVGRMPLPPRWSLGFQQCRYSYYPESRVREIAAEFRNRAIPCDVIYLDIHYMDGYRIFTWNKERFPDPGKMVADLRKDGFKVAVIVDPGIKEDTTYHAYRSGLAGDYFLKYPNGKPFIGKVWPGECAFPDFSNPATRTWWGEQFASLVNIGVRGWWNDMNEPSVFDVPTKTIDLNVINNDNGLMTTQAKGHNLYGMQMTQATYEGVRKLLPTERPFVLTRASYAGGHRYSAAWTGDNIASWEHLEMAVPMCLNLSISGQPYVGTDIGGFVGNLDGELFARWLQLGVFTPLMRAHTEIGSMDKEPWVYGPEFTDINRETIGLRYTLLPYIYNSMYEASITGIPPMRPLIFEYPDDWHFTWTDGEFMFGNDLLIAPVLEEGSSERRLRLPNGDWYDYWSGAKLNGGEHITVVAPLDRIPIFVKAGAIIPSQQLVQYSDEEPIDPLTLIVYPPSSSHSSSSYYEDDGLSFDYQKRVYLKRTFAQTVTDTSTTLVLSETEGSYTPPARSVIAKFHGVTSSPRNVEVQGVDVIGVGTEKFQSATKAWRYDKNAKAVYVKIEDQMAEQRITLKR